MSPSVISNGFALTDPPLAFSGQITRTRLPPTYRLGLVVVAVTMLLLPVLYLALIAAAGAGVWWHATANTWILEGSGGKQIRLLAYLTPLVAGLVLVFFMVKPILARAARRQQPLQIAGADEPALFAFVGEICRQVGARRPRRVQVDCNVNASASLMDSRLGLLRRDLVLTIGLPLVAGLSARQFAGVLAHEFGHFAQGGGMRLTTIVRMVNAWFARVVYERDAWDEKLERWSTEADWRAAIVLVVARLGVWFSRQVLHVLMIGGHAISCFMLRQMEYDADSYEIKIAGTDAFIQTASRLRELGAGAQLAYGDLKDAWSHGTLPANLPALMIERTHRMPPDLLATARQGHDEATGWFDTHPSDADRVRAAEAARSAGVLVGGDDPAVRLFRDFEALSAGETRHYFERELGLDLTRVTLVGTDAALVRGQQREAHAGAIRQFFGRRFTPFRPVRIRLADLEGLDAAQLILRSAAARKTMSAAEEKTAQTYQEFDASESERLMAFAAAELLAAGFTKLRAEQFGLPEGTAAAAESAHRAATDRQQVLAAALEPYETAVATRLSCGLLLMREAGGTTTDDEMTSTVNDVNALAGVMGDVRELHLLVFASNLVDSNARSSPDHQRTAERRAHLQRRTAGRLEAIQKALGGSPALAARCGFPPSGAMASASGVIEHVLGVYIELIGRVAAAVLGEESRRSESRRS